MFDDGYPHLRASSWQHDRDPSRHFGHDAAGRSLLLRRRNLVPSERERERERQETRFLNQSSQTHTQLPRLIHQRKLDIMMVPVDDDEDDFIVQAVDDPGASEAQQQQASWSLKKLGGLVFASTSGKEPEPEPEPEPTLPAGFSATLNAEEEEIYPAEVRVRSRSTHDWDTTPPSPTGKGRTHLFFPDLCFRQVFI